MKILHEQHDEQPPIAVIWNNRWVGMWMPAAGLMESAWLLVMMS